MSHYFVGMYPFEDELLIYPRDEEGEEIIVQGSDAEDSPRKKAVRCVTREAIGWAYLRYGNVPFIQSARLTGLFDVTEEWTANPWRRTESMRSIEPQSLRLTSSRGPEPDEGDKARGGLAPSSQGWTYQEPTSSYIEHPLTEPTVSEAPHDLHPNARDVIGEEAYDAEDDMPNDEDVLQSAQQKIDTLYSIEREKQESVKDNDRQGPKRGADLNWLKSARLMKRPRHESTHSSSPTPKAPPRRRSSDRSKKSSARGPDRRHGNNPRSGNNGNTRLRTCSPSTYPYVDLSTFPSGIGGKCAITDQVVEEEDDEDVRAQQQETTRFTPVSIAKLISRHSLLSPKESLIGHVFTRQRNRDRHLEPSEIDEIQRSMGTSKMRPASALRKSDQGLLRLPQGLTATTPGKDSSDTKPANLVARWEIDRKALDADQLHGLSQASNLASAARTSLRCAQSPMHTSHTFAAVEPGASSTGKYHDLPVQSGSSNYRKTKSRAGSRMREHAKRSNTDAEIHGQTGPNYSDLVHLKRPYRAPGILQLSTRSQEASSLGVGQSADGRYEGWHQNNCGQRKTSSNGDRSTLMVEDTAHDAGGAAEELQKPVVGQKRQRKDGPSSQDAGEGSEPQAPELLNDYPRASSATIPQLRYPMSGSSAHCRNSDSNESETLIGTQQMVPCQRLDNQEKIKTVQAEHTSLSSSARTSSGTFAAQPTVDDRTNEDLWHRNTSVAHFNVEHAASWLAASSSISRDSKAKIGSDGQYSDTKDNDKDQSPWIRSESNNVVPTKIAPNFSPQAAPEYRIQLEVKDITIISNGDVDSPLSPESDEADKDQATRVTPVSERDSPTQRFNTPRENTGMTGFTAELPVHDGQLEEITATTFKDLMSPSPVRWQEVAVNCLPSTQLLIEATTANPWVSSLKKPRSRRSTNRVSFGVLDSDDNMLDGAGDVVAAETPKTFVVSSEKDSEESPDQEDYESSDSVRPVVRIKRRLESPSQRSPAIGAMAEAFLHADGHSASDNWDSSLSTSATDSEDDLQDFASKNGHGEDPPAEDHSHGYLESSASQDRQCGPSFAISPSGDVTALEDHVISVDVEANLGAAIEEMGSFLEGWDVNSELKKASQEMLRGGERRRRDKGRFLSGTAT
ncbi:MAG: hypothetical protein M1818_001812 [Claussenomyces sp. TS43310]|nr:MAG: hypothetical protein M1818_001812 [Claussenomyces sp. TS43310]